MAENLIRRLYLEDTKGWENVLSQKRFSDKELKVTVVDKGIILPSRLLPKPNILAKSEGGVCDKDLNFVAGDRAEGDTHNITSAYTVDKKDITYLDEDVIYGGAPVGHFGHFITECWNRLWFILQDLQVDRGGAKR
ncbi:MAG: hypothetical protein IJG33_11350 [Selenomonadaceae bacterium]|nr:hypothetical protein [Selenomonadaceae bacterium]